VLPSIAYINTSSTVAQVTTVGYLNHAVKSGTSFALPCLALVSTRESAGDPIVTNTYNVSHSGEDWSLEATSSGGGAIVLPTKAGHIATYTDTAGTLSEDAYPAINANPIQSGLADGTGGAFIVYPGGFGGEGYTYFYATANSGDYPIFMTNQPMGQTTLLFMPDPLDSAGHFLIGTGFTPFVDGNFPQNNGTDGAMIDSGVSVASIADLATPIGKIKYVDATLLAADIAAGVHIIPGVLPGESFKLRSLAVNLSPGMSGGDKDIVLSNGFNFLVTIEAALVQTPITTLWGGTGVTFSATTPVNQTSFPGGDFYFISFNGTTDYTDGSIDVTVGYEQIT
jgi:hypothetical protein